MARHNATKVLPLTNPTKRDPNRNTNPIHHSNPNTNPNHKPNPNPTKP